MDRTQAAARRAKQAAGAALGITLVLTVAKLVVWGVTGSLAVLGQTLDSAVDIVALGLVYLAVRVSDKPADESHHYGHAKAENLVAFTQTLILAAIVLWVVVEASTRLPEGGDPVRTPWYAFALLGGSVLIDVFRVGWLRSVARQRGSEALRAGALNLSTDIGTSAVALVSLGLVELGFPTADAYGGLLVAAAVLVAAANLGRRSVDVLMDRAPSARRAEIADAAKAAEGVEETRRVRLRDDGRRMFADVTVAAGRTTSLQRAHDIAENVEREIERVVPGSDVVVHVEPASETSGLVEVVHAAASRVTGVTEVHNVLVHAFNDEGNRKLHVTLHAKVAPDTSLDSAHELSDAIEDAVAAEIGADARVDTHIEPRELTTPGRDVTDQRDDVVTSLRAAAHGESDVIDCHDVVITSTQGELAVVAHVRGRGDLPLHQIHAASKRIEKMLIAAHPEVGSVVIHFEPA